MIFDSHLDLAWNALSWNRDLTATIPEMRDSEVGMSLMFEGVERRGRNTVSFPEMRKGEVAVCLATVLSRASSRNEPILDYRNTGLCWAAAQGQLAYYRLMEHQGQMRMLKDFPSLDAHVREWQSSAGVGVSFGSGTGVPPVNGHGQDGRATANDTTTSAGDSKPIGFILSMEGADPILAPSQVGEWWNAGLRVVEPVHFGVSTYSHGTGSPGGLTAKGRDLLKAMQEAGMVLDVTHLADEAFWQSMDLYQGPVLASHHNCRALVPGDRQLTDEQIRCLIERQGVIGAACDAWMLCPGYVCGKTSNATITLASVVEHIDHVCQLAGNARHSAIGSDLDGGFGTEQCPSDLDTIADLQKIAPLLRQRGYQADDIEGIMWRNWFSFFERAWAGRG
jgi:membrane dipeptidase